MHQMKEMSCFIQMHFALAQHVNKEKKVHLWPQLIEHKKTTTYDVVSSIYLDVTHDIASMMNNLIYFSEYEVPI